MLLRVRFCPESIMTEVGKDLFIKKFFKNEANQMWRRALKSEKILAIATFIMIVTVAVWAAFRPDLIPHFNLVLLAGLIAVTTIYAYSTIQISRATKDQADKMTEQAEATRQQADASVNMAEEMREQRVMASRPVIIQKAVVETETKFRTFDSLDWFSHFGVYNAGNGPAIEVEISLLNKEKTPIHSHRKSFLRAGENPIEFSPTDLASLEKSTFYLVAEYQSVFSHGSQPTWYQTWLPFETVEAGKQGKIYVKAGELEFKEVNEKDRLDAFSSRSKPK